MTRSDCRCERTYGLGFHSYDCPNAPGYRDPNTAQSERQTPDATEAPPARELSPNTRPRHPSWEPSKHDGEHLAQRAPLDERFWRYVEKGESDACWMWTGSRNNYGYGSITVTRGRAILAHRLSFELHHGPLPKGAVVRHTCDVRACVNPAHLTTGSQRENVMDAIRKGRHPTRNLRGQR